MRKGKIMRKRFGIAALCCVILLSLAGCGKTDSKKTSNSGQNSGNNSTVSSANGNNDNSEKADVNQEKNAPGTVRNPVDFNNFKVLIEGTFFEVPYHGKQDLPNYEIKPIDNSIGESYYVNYTGSFDDMIYYYGSPEVRYTNSSRKDATFYVQYEVHGGGEHENMPLKECYIMGFDVSGTYDFLEKDKEPAFIFQGDIVIGTSTSDDCIQAYGQPKKDHYNEYKGETTLFFDYGDYYQVRVTVKNDVVIKYWMWVSVDHPLIQAARSK